MKGHVLCLFYWDGMHSQVRTVFGGVCFFSFFFFLPFSCLLWVARCGHRFRANQNLAFYIGHVCGSAYYGGNSNHGPVVVFLVLRGGGTDGQFDVKQFSLVLFLIFADNHICSRILISLVLIRHFVTG